MVELDESWLIPDPEANPSLRKFAPEEMLTCGACLRANAPTRGECIYCGAGLITTSTPAANPIAALSPATSPTHYVAVRRVRNDRDDQPVLEKLAAKFCLKPEELRVALNTGQPVPVFATSSDEATAIAGQLMSDEIESAVIPGAELGDGAAHINIRAFEFRDTGIAAHAKHRGEQLFASWSDLALIVTGRLLMHRVEVDERRSRTTVKSLDRREISQDQSVIDLYSGSDNRPWRIIVNDFDFSCLGAGKSLTAFDNVKQLLERLTDQSDAELNDSYGAMRPLLANIWPLESTERQGRSQRPRASRREISTVTSSDNEAQFNRYSRLAWIWKNRGRKSDR